MNSAGTPDWPSARELPIDGLRAQDIFDKHKLPRCAPQVCWQSRVLPATCQTSVNFAGEPLTGAAETVLCSRKGIQLDFSRISVNYIKVTVVARKSIRLAASSKTRRHGNICPESSHHSAFL